MARPKHPYKGLESCPATSASDTAGLIGEYQAAFLDTSAKGLRARTCFLNRLDHARGRLEKGLDVDTGHRYAIVAAAWFYARSAVNQRKTWDDCNKLYEAVFGESMESVLGDGAEKGKPMYFSYSPFGERPMDAPMYLMSLLPPPPLFKTVREDAMTSRMNKTSWRDGAPLAPSTYASRTPSGAPSTYASRTPSGAPSTYASRTPSGAPSTYASRTPSGAPSASASEFGFGSAASGSSRRRRSRRSRSHRKNRGRTAKNRRNARTHRTRHMTVSKSRTRV